MTDRLAKRYTEQIKQAENPDAILMQTLEEEGIIGSVEDEEAFLTDGLEKQEEKLRVLREARKRVLLAMQTVQRHFELRPPNADLESDVAAFLDAIRNVRQLRQDTVSLRIDKLKITFVGKDADRIPKEIDQILKRVSEGKYYRRDEPGVVDMKALYQDAKKVVEFLGGRASDLHRDWTTLVPDEPPVTFPYSRNTWRAARELLLALFVIRRSDPLTDQQLRTKFQALEAQQAAGITPGDSLDAKVGKFLRFVGMSGAVFLGVLSAFRGGKVHTGLYGILALWIGPDNFGSNRVIARALDAGLDVNIRMSQFTHNEKVKGILKETGWKVKDIAGAADEYMQLRKKWISLSSDRLVTDVEVKELGKEIGGVDLQGSPLARLLLAVKDDAPAPPEDREANANRQTAGRKRVTLLSAFDNVWWGGPKGRELIVDYIRERKVEYS